MFAPCRTTQHGEPSVKYRGIFLNDEAPSLTGWVLEKFGKYNSQFYEKVFELLLRLKVPHSAFLESLVFLVQQELTILGKLHVAGHVARISQSRRFLLHR